MLPHAAFRYAEDPKVSGQSAKLVLFEDPAAKRDPHWDGRHALCLPDDRVRAAAAKVAQYQAEEALVELGVKDTADFPFAAAPRIVHPVQELKEKLGTILLAVVGDPDGHEVAVGSDGIPKQMKAATDLPKVGQVMER